MIVSSSKSFIMIHVPKTGGTTLTYTFGPHSDMIAKYPFLGQVLDTTAPNELRWKFNTSDVKARLVDECREDIAPSLLRDLSGLGYQAVAHHRFLQHSRLADEVNREVLGACDGFFKFAFVRNPFDYMFSLFLDKIVGKGSWSAPQPAVRRRELLTKARFEEFVADVVEEPGDLKLFTRRTQLSYLLDLRGELASDHVARYERYDQEVDYLSRHLGIEQAQVAPQQRNRANLEGLEYRDFYDARSKSLVETCFAVDLETFDYEF